ncbi:MAG: hypothetical protein IIA91_02440 [Chloroflexi bacterium]|nr:hypothetical protein [Chloroflexota bacterium]
MATNRQRSSRKSPGDEPAGTIAEPGSLLLRGDEVAAAMALVGFVLLFVAIALLASGGTGGGGAATGDADLPISQSGASDTGAAPVDEVQPGASGEQEIQSLARRSIEALPAGQWPSLYDSFTSEFQGRCPRAKFDQAGLDAAVQLGDDLQLLRFKRLESVTVEGSIAQAIIVGEIAGQSEYQIQAAFQLEGGSWKIAPASGTAGCEAFSRLSG